MKCKHCGSNIGFYTKLKGIQYYNENAESQGCDVSTEDFSVYCQECDERVCNLTEFYKKAKEMKEGGASDA